VVASVGVITAGRGYDYLTKEVATSKHDYYTGTGEAPGQWAGRSAALLGLSGEVDADDMAVLYGRFVVPSTAGGTRLPSGRWEPEQVLGRAVSTRVRADGSVLEPTAALDVTFSPSKSVSLLWALSSNPQVRESVVDAHEAAVATALEYLDAHASHTRTGAGGVRRVESGGFVIAKFRHRTARSTVPGERVGDPQLHSHCAILNRVRGVDGVWRTLDSRAIHRHAHAAGAIYAAELERLLSERLGVSWERPQSRTPMREIVGIRADLRARFSSRRAAVLSTYGRLEGEWRRIHGRSPTRDEAARMRDEATVRSRHRKTGGTVDLHERWRSMTTAGELAAVDTATNIRTASIGDGGRLAAGSTELAEKVFAELHQQRAWWTRAHLTVEVARWISEPSPPSVEVEVECLAAMCLPLEPDRDVEYAQPDIAKLTSPTIMQAERRVLSSLDEPAPFTIAAVRDPRLGDDQIRAVRAITEGRRRVTTIIGPAGAGKTTMLQAAGRSVDYAARDMTVLCLSAAAARVVTEETGMAAHTIASWRIGQVELPVGGVVVVDEASMVPTLVLDELVAATRRTGSRLTLVGDYAQMGAPEAGGLLRDLAAHSATVHLTSVRRFRNEWERTASIRLRNRDTSVIDDYLRHGRLRPIWSDIADIVVVDAWHTDITAGRDTIIVTDTTDLAASVSAACQQRLLDTGHLTGPSVGVAADGNPVHVGDLIQTRRNTRDLVTSDGRRVLNRDVWRITDSTPDGRLVAVHTCAGHEVTITPEYAAADVVLAYATTIAGAQGRTADRGHVLVTPQTSAQALYVGMTRGRESNIAHVVCDGHDHQELGLGDRTPRDAFAAAMQRDPDGNLSAHTIAERWHNERPARNAARTADRQLQQAETFWNKQLRSLPTRVQQDLAGEHTAIVRVLARLDSDTERTAAVRAALPILSRPRIGAGEFVAFLSTSTQRRSSAPGMSTGVRTPARAQQPFR
jgi:conjugative relaxase-like TrwC/TraI family protein